MSTSDAKIRIRFTGRVSVEARGRFKGESFLIQTFALVIEQSVGILVPGDYFDLHSESINDLHLI